MPAQGVQVVSDELAGFIESGVSVLVGTRDAGLLPSAMRGMGVRVEEGGAEVTVFLPEATSARAIANLRDNGHVAVCFSRPQDHRSIQVKGRAVAIRAAGASDRPVVERYRGALAESLAFVGVPVPTTLRLAHWPCHAVRVRVEGVFQQTPGPDAGAPLGAGGRAA